MPPGISAGRCAGGSAAITVPSNATATVSASSSAACPSRVPGSTRSNPSGCIASARLSSPPACSAPRRWPTGCAPITAVRTSHTSRFLIPFSTRPVDHALGALLLESILGPVRDRCAGNRVATVATDQQPLEQVAGAAHVGTKAPLILGKLFLHGGKERRIHKGRHREGDPVLRWHAILGRGPARVGALAPYRPERLAVPGTTARPAVGRFAFVGRIVEHGSDRATVPPQLAPVGWDIRVRQTASDLANGEAVAPDPLKDLRSGAPPAPR